MLCDMNPPQGDDHICCSSLSPCGGWLAYSTVSSVRLYRIQHENNNISIKKVRLPNHQLQMNSHV